MSGSRRRSGGRETGLRKLPDGTVTFLFTDVEGSTRLLDELGPEAYSASLADHRRAIRRACAEPMPMRFRRSIKLGKGVRLNVSKTGFGVSAGIPGARYSVHSSGRRTRSVGIPSSGVGFVSTSSGGSKRASSGDSRSRRQQMVVPPLNFAAVLPKPGLFSGKAEKRYHEGVHAYLRGEHQKALTALEEVLSADPSAISAHLIAAICVGKVDGPDADQIRHLEALISSDASMPDKLQMKYLPPAIVSLKLMGKITENINAEVPFDSTGATLLLAEHYQEADRLQDAIGLVQQLYQATERPGHQALAG